MDQKIELIPKTRIKRGKRKNKIRYRLVYGNRLELRDGIEIGPSNSNPCI